jgi:CSLREA domain-containing protein
MAAAASTTLTSAQLKRARNPRRRSKMLKALRTVGAAAGARHWWTWSAVVFLGLLLTCASATTPVARAYPIAVGTTAGELGRPTDVNPARTLATWTVTKAADTNDGVCNSGCSQREAIAAAAASDTIVFASGLVGQTITLTLAQLTLSTNVTIDGSALASPITIDGSNASGVFYVNSGVNATLNGL